MSNRRELTLKLSAVGVVTDRTERLVELTHDTPSLVISAICVRDSGRFVLSHLGPCDFCARTVSHERAATSDYLLSVLSTEATSAQILAQNVESETG